jgi:transposase
MPHPSAAPIELSPRQHLALQTLATNSSDYQSLVSRARVILLAGEGKSNSSVGLQLNLSRNTVALWRSRWIQYAEQLTNAEVRGVQDKTLLALISRVLSDLPRSGAPRICSHEQIAQILLMANQNYDAAKPATPEALASEIARSGVLPPISPRSVRRILKLHSSQFRIPNRQARRNALPKI